MKTEKKRIFDFTQFIVLALLFLASMNLGNYYVYFWFLAGGVCVFMNGRKLKVNSMLAVLILFSISYLVFNPKVSGSVTELLKQFLYPLCYLIGLNFIRRDDKEDMPLVERQIYIMIVICAMGAFVHYLLNMSINYTSWLRNNADVWTGEIMTATGQAALSILALGVFVAWLLSNRAKKIFASIGILLIMAYDMVLACRTPIMMAAVVLVVAFFFSMRTAKSRKEGRLLTVLAIVALVLLAYALNWFGLRDFISDSNLSVRFDIMDWSEDQRTKNKLRYVKLLLDYPFGGGKLFEVTGGYAHELYLDVYSDAGVIAYLLVTIFAIDAFLTALRIVRKGNVREDFRLLVLCVFLAVFFEFFLEPIIQGMPWMFCIFCYISGMLKNVSIHRSGKRLKVGDAV